MSLLETNLICNLLYSQGARRFSQLLFLVRKIEMVNHRNYSESKFISSIIPCFHFLENNGRRKGNGLAHVISRGIYFLGVSHHYLLELYVKN